jgi:hypothetical protein
VPLRDAPRYALDRARPRAARRLIRRGAILASEHRCDPPASRRHGRGARESRSRAGRFEIIADTLKAVAAQQRQTIAEERAELARSASAKIGLFADSLARRAAMAHNAADSAALYRQALIVRTDERDSLLFVIVGKDAAIKAANDRAADFRAGLLVSDPARQRADSVLDSVVGAVNKAECRVPLTFGLLKCMSRTKAAVVGVAIGVGGTLAVQAIRDGRLKIPLRLP